VRGTASPRCSLDPNTRSRSAAFAAGVAGFNLAEQIVVVLLLYFYLPPEGRGLAAQLPVDPVLGPLTAFGAAMLLGRAIDSLADPVIGHLSDRSRSRHGRRRVFLIAAVVPLCVLPAGAFFPPAGPGSSANAWFLALLLAGFFAAFASYVVPLLALLPELAREPLERARLTTWAGASGLAIGLGFPSLAFVGVSWAQTGLGLDAASALRAVALASALAALGLCAWPIWGLHGEGPTGSPSSLGLADALRATLRDGPFGIYVLGQAFLVLAIGLVAPLLPYLAVSVLHRSEAFVAVLSAPIALGALAGFALLQRTLALLGPRRTLLAAALLAAPCAALWSVLGPEHLELALGSLALLGASIAAFSALPYLVLAQLIDADAARCGTSRAALYFGVQGLALKWVRGLGGALLAWSFATWGNSPDRSGGIRVAELLASLCLVAAAACFAAYPERRVLGASTTRSEPEPSRGHP
jgi:GPH family glycoside/pentoside/hexuronide:cation symporter